MRVVLVGGGTGGHFYPLIAVAEALRATHEAIDMYYLGPTVYDERALTAHNIQFSRCPAGKLRRYASFKNFLDLFITGYGILVAIVKLFILYPDVVFSKGGYASVPVTLAARLLFIPVVIHESDSVPGVANKIAASGARYIAISYDEAAKYFPPEKTALIGIPIRKKILAQHDKETARNTLNIPNDKPLIYVTGGSSGAERLNYQIAEMLPEILQIAQVFHQVGPNSVPLVEELVKAKVRNSDLLQNYYLQGHLNEDTVAMVLSAADLVISRAGSTTLFEVAQHEIPAILVPIPEDISHDQRTNAYAYARDGAAVVIEEQNISDSLLLGEIDSILTDTNRYQAMVAATKSIQYPEAANKISDILISIGKEHGS